MKLQRNTSFAIAATLLFAGFANLTAQTAPNVKMGLRVSPNFSWINIQKGSMSNDGLGLGFSYGVTADFAMFKSTNCIYKSIKHGALCSGHYFYLWDKCNEGMKLKYLENIPKIAKAIAMRWSL